MFKKRFRDRIEGRRQSQLYRNYLDQSKVKLTKPGTERFVSFFPVDLHIYWGRVYGGTEKTARPFNGQKGWLRIFILSHPFYVRKDVAVFFHRRGTFGDALCIKILDRKCSAVPRIWAHVSQAKYRNHI